MDKGMADYLARMEATVLAARDGMLQLRNENSKLKARIAVLEAQIKEGANIREERKLSPRRNTTTVERKAKSTAVPQPPVRAPEPEDTGADDAHGLLSLIDEGMMQWSSASESIAASESSSSSSDEDDASSESDDLPEEEVEEDNAPVQNNPMPAASVHSVAAVLGELMTPVATESQRCVAFDGLISRFSVGRLAVDIVAWLTKAAKVSWPIGHSFSLSNAPKTIGWHTDVVQSLFNHLWRATKSRRADEAAFKNNIGDQLLLRIVEMTFSINRIAHGGRADMVPFLSVLIGSGSGFGLLSASTIEMDVSNSVAACLYSDDYNDTCGSEHHEQLWTTGYVSFLLVKIVVRALSVLRPRRPLFVRGFVLEGIRSAAVTGSWGLALGIIDTLLDSTTCAVVTDSFHASGIILSMKIMLHSVLQQRVLQQAKISVQERWTMLIKIMEYADAAAETPSAKGIVSSALESFSGSSSYRISEKFTPCWERSRTGRDGEAVQSTILQRCDRESNLLVLSTMWSQIGIWPSLEILGKTLLDSVGVCDVSVLSLLGFSAIEEFSTGITRFLQNHVAECGGADVNVLSGRNEFHARFDLLYNWSCARGIVAHVPALTERSADKKIHSYFLKFWKDVSIGADRSGLSYTQSWRLLSSCIQSVLPEYDVAGAGWRVGKMGKAENMNSRLSTHIDAIRSTFVSMNKLIPRESILDAESHIFMKHPFMFSSLNMDVSKSAMETARAAAAVLESYTANSGSDSQLENISKHLKHVFTLLSLMAFEQFLQLVYRNAISFLEILSTSVKSGLMWLGEDGTSAGMECARLLLALPPPWCVKSRIEDINIILSFARDIQFSQRRPFLSSTAFEQRILTSVAFQPVSGWVLTLPFLHPAIVINLDRRSDRRKRMDKICFEAGIVVARLPAVDAFYGENTGSSTALEVDVPPSIVLSNWDSTLNATFDATCMTNSSIPMSSSERACAASHTLVWQSIVDIDSKRGATVPSPQSNSVKNFAEKHFGTVDYGCYGDWLENLGACHSLSHAFPLVKDCAVGKGRNAQQVFYLVLEDDILIREKGSTASFVSFIRYVLESLPADCEMCYLGYAANWKMQNHDSARLKSANDSIFFVPSYLWQLHGYLLSSAGASKLLSYLPIDAPADNYVARLVYEKKIKCLALKDKLLLQSDWKMKAYGNCANKVEDSNINHSAAMMAMSSRVAQHSRAPLKKKRRLKK